MNSQPQSQRQRPRGSSRISVTLPAELIDRIGKVAAYQGRSMSNLVAYLIEHSMDSSSSAS